MFGILTKQASYLMFSVLTLILATNKLVFCPFSLYFCVHSFYKLLPRICHVQACFESMPEANSTRCSPPPITKSHFQFTLHHFSLSHFSPSPLQPEYILNLLFYFQIRRSSEDGWVAQQQCGEQSTSCQAEAPPSRTRVGATEAALEKRTSLVAFLPLLFIEPGASFTRSS